MLDRKIHMSRPLSSAFRSFEKDEVYLEHIRQKEIHLNIARSPINRIDEQDLIKVGGLPDALSMARVDFLVSTLREKYKQNQFVQIACPGFDAQSIQRYNAYYSSPEQRQILYKALLQYDLDVLVLPLTELENTLPPGIRLAAITQRKAPEYALLTCKHAEDSKAKEDKIAVYSLSLAQQLRKSSGSSGYMFLEHAYNYAQGLKILREGKFQGVVVPLCDLLWLGAEYHEDLSYTVFIPQHVAPPAGQGSLAVLVRQKEEKLSQLLKNYLHHILSAYTYEWEKKASLLLDYHEEKAGSYMELVGGEYFFYLYNPQYLQPFQRSVGRKVGKQDTGVDVREFNALLQQVYGELSLIGLGLGSIGGITLEAKRQLQQTEYLYYSGVELTSFNSLIGLTCTLINIDEEVRYQSLTYLLQQIREQLMIGYKVSIALAGDPLFLNVGNNILRALRKERIPYKIIAGLPPFTAAATALAQPLIQAGLSSSCHIIDCRDPRFLDSSFQHWHGTLVFYARTNQISAILNKLENEHFDPRLPCAYLAYRGLGGQLYTLRSELGSFFRHLHTMDRSLDGYFIVGKVLQISEQEQEVKATLLPQSGMNILVPVTKKLNEVDQSYLRQCENLGAKIIEYRLGTPVVEKKCIEELRSTIDSIVRGEFRLSSPYRVQHISASAKNKNKGKKESKLQTFSKRNIWLAFRSVVAVEVFFQVYRDAGYDMRLLAPLRFASVNQAVFRALGKEGIQSDLVPKVEDDEHLALALMELMAKEDLCISFSAESRPNIFEAFMASQNRHLHRVGVYEQQLKFPNAKQIIKLIESCQVALFFDTDSTVTFIQALVTTGFNHDMLRARNIQFLASNTYVRNVLESSGFEVKEVEEVLGKRQRTDLGFKS